MSNGPCPQCGAMLTSGQAKCWLCHAEAPVVASLVEGRPGAGQRPAPPAGRFQFGLSSLMLFITLVAILCSIVSMHLGLGILVAVMTVPAFLRVCMTASRRRARGQPMSRGEKGAVFLLTLAMIVIVIVAACAAVFFTCASAFGKAGAASSVWSQIGIAAFTFAVLLGWLFWEVSRRKPGRWTIVTVIVATGAAFFFTSLGTGVVAPGGPLEDNWRLAFLLGGLAALTVAVLLAWLSWKESRRKPDR